VEFGVSNFAHAPDVAARKYLYLLSDGQQTEPFSQSRYDALMSSIRDEHPNLTISALAVTPEADMEELLSYTAPTGGAIGYAEEANGAPVYWHDVEAQNIRELAVLAGPDKITTPADLIIQEASTSGSIDFEVSLDATALSVVLSSRTRSWNLRLALVDRLGNRDTLASHPQRFSKPSYDDTLLMVNLPNPTDGRWTMVTGDPVEQSSNFIITEVNPVASLELDGDTHVIRSGQAAQLTPEIEYRGVPLDVNTANCSVVKATVPGGRTLYANELPAASIVLSNTSDRVAAGLPPRLQVTPFAGRGYYTVQVRCAVTASARARPPAQLNGVVRSFTHNASFTVFADVPQMPACTSADCDGDGVPNSQEGSGDSDGDGWLDSYDSDADNDDFGDARDTCPTVANPEQRPNLPGVVLTTSDMTLSSCAGPSVSTMLTRPTLAVGCVDPATVTLTAALISVNGRALPSPQPIDPANATLPVGTSVVRWTGIASFGATGSAQQTITIGASESAAACCAGKTVVQGTALPDLLLRPQDGQFCMFGQGSFDLLLGGPGADGMFGGDGLDKITSGDAGSVVSGGPGADVLTTLAGSTYGSAGGDVIEMSGGGALYGNEGDDDIVSVLANHHIYPGPGRDIVLAGLGDDHVYVYDACELAALEVLDGGLGNDTLHIPLPLLDVLGRGVIVLNFENIVVETNNRHLSECFQ
jgi:Thrombospondin type 3 repeat